MSTQPHTILSAQAFVTASGSVIDTADAIAAVAIDHLCKSEVVEVSMAGLSGVSSSFFNLLFRRVIENCGVNVLDQRLTFLHVSAVQTQLLTRSLAATKKCLASMNVPPTVSWRPHQGHHPFFTAHPNEILFPSGSSATKSRMPYG